MIANQVNEENPYTPAISEDNGFLFYGRESIFPWIQAALLQVIPEEGPAHPVILTGRHHIGKTAILKQIENSKLSPAYTAIYIDLNELPLDSTSEFLWGIAAAAATQLKHHHLEIPPLNHTKFVGDPFQAFREQLLLPATVALKETQPELADGRASGKLLFLFDNLNALLQLENSNGSKGLFKQFHEQIYRNQLAACLFTYQIENGSLNEELFADAQIYEIGPLSLKATVDLIRQPVRYKIFQDVAEYIANISQNRPYETQLVCHELFQRQQNLNLSLITVADAKAAHRSLQEQKRAGVELNMAPPAFQINQKTSSFQTIHRSARPAIWQHRRFIFAILLIFILGIIITAVPALSGKSWSEQLAGFSGGNDVSPTPVITIQPTIQLVVIVESPTPQPTPTQTHTPTPTNTPRPSSTPRPSATPTTTPTAKPTILPESFVREQDQMPMRLIPGGTFMMGSEDNDFLAAVDERPIHEVTLDPFYMDQFEVSAEQYTILLNRLGTYDDSCDRFDCISPRNEAGYTSFVLEEDLGDGIVQYYALAGYGDYPMNHVSWYGASVYCQFVGGRLPTEAEWEYAARGTDGRIYPWGNGDPNPDRAVYQSLDFENLKPVDALPEGASPFGLYGMAGSMWEWTADWYDESYYEESPAENPPGPETGLFKVIRGGAWPNNNQKDRIRVNNRSSLSPDFFSSTVGFRCAYDP